MAAHPTVLTRSLSTVAVLFTLILFSILAPIILNVLGLTSPVESQAHPPLVNFPRVAAVGSGMSVGVLPSCPSGWGQNMHETGSGQSNSRWIECINGAYNYPTSPPLNQPIGNHETTQCPSTVPNDPANVITGWACDQDNWNTAIDVHIFRDDGALVGQVNANQFRQDLVNNNVCGGTGNHGFSVPIPESMRDDRSHTYTVYAIDDGTNGPAGDPALASSDNEATCPIPPPPPPDPVACIFDPVTQTLSATANWSAPAGYNTFYVRLRNDTTGNTITLPNSEDWASTTYTFSNLTQAHRYSWWVHTKNPAAPQPNWSVPVGGSFQCPIPEPGAPSNVRATCDGATRVATFRASALRATMYDIELENTYTGDDWNINSVTLPHNRSNMAWAPYQWRVRGCNLDVNGVKQCSENPDGSELWSSMLDFRCEPPPPTITITATPSLVLTGSQAQLTWTVNTTPDYRMSCTLTGGATTYTYTHTGGTSNNPVTDPGNFPGVFLTQPISNTTNFTLTCTPQIAALPGLAPTSRSVRVEVAGNPIEN